MTPEQRLINQGINIHSASGLRKLAFEYMQLARRTRVHTGDTQNVRLCVTAARSANRQANELTRICRQYPELAAE